jgi:hypothetical protein
MPDSQSDLLPAAHVAAPFCQASESPITALAHVQAGSTPTG